MNGRLPETSPRGTWRNRPPARSVLWALAAGAALLLQAADPAGAQQQAQPAAAATDAGVQPAVLRARYDADTNRLLLVWPAPVPLEITHDSQEILIRSGPPVDAAALGSLSDAMAPWVASVSWGYDSVLLELSDGTGSRVEQHPDGVAVTFGPDMADDRPAPSAAQLPAADTVIVDPPGVLPTSASEAEIRRQLLLARADLLDGAPGAAEARTGAMLALFPDRRDVLDSAADAAAQAGDWQTARGLYDRLRSQAPSNTAYIRAAREARRQWGNRLTVSGFYQDVEDSDTQRGVEAVLRVQPLDGWTMHARIRQRHMTSDNVLRPDGQILPYDGDRADGELEAAWRASTDWTFAGRLLINPRGVGAGGRILYGPPARRLTLTGAWNEANYDYTETIADAGTRDSAAIGYRREIGTDITVQGSAHAYRYSLPDLSGVASTAGFGAEIDYLLLPELFAGGPSAVASYRFDGDWVMHSEERVSAQGQTYNPLPITSREANTIAIGLFGWLSQDTDYGVQLGYTYDRIQGQSPEGSAQLRYQPTDALEIFGDVSYGLSNGRGNDAKVARAGLGVAVNF